MPVFSVVVPSYGNVEYISQCLDSLIAQSFTDWEAIIVDDCSCDGSLALVDIYAERTQGSFLLQRAAMKVCTVREKRVLKKHQVITSSLSTQMTLLIRMLYVF